MGKARDLKPRRRRTKAELATADASRRTEIGRESNAAASLFARAGFTSANPPATVPRVPGVPVPTNTTTSTITPPATPALGLLAAATLGLGLAASAGLPVRSSRAPPPIRPVATTNVDTSGNSALHVEAVTATEPGKLTSTVASHGAATAAASSQVSPEHSSDVCVTPTDDTPLNLPQHAQTYTCLAHTNTPPPNMPPGWSREQT